MEILTLDKLGQKEALTVSYLFFVSIFIYFNKFLFNLKGVFPKN